MQTTLTLSLQSSVVQLSLPHYHDVANSVDKLKGSYIYILACTYVYVGCQVRMPSTTKSFDYLFLCENYSKTLPGKGISSYIYLNTL